MTITTRDELINAMANNTSRFFVDKASLASTTAGQFFSLWTPAGLPGIGVAPTTAVVPTEATAGAIGFTTQTGAVKSYLGWCSTMSYNSLTSTEIHDRIAHMAGLSGTVITAQGALNLLVTNPGADRIGASNYSDVQWWLEVYVALGATAVNATVNVTYNDATTGNLTAVALGATPRQGRMYQLRPLVAGKHIRAVNSVTLSASTLTAGNFGITATRPRASMSVGVFNNSVNFDWAQLGLPEIPNNSCLFPVVICNTTSTGVLRMQGKIIHG